MMSDLPTGQHAWDARGQAWNLMSDLHTDLYGWNLMSVLPMDLQAWNGRGKAWNLMSGLSAGLHAWNARWQAWNLMSGYMLAFMHGMPVVKSGI